MAIALFDHGREQVGDDAVEQGVLVVEVLVEGRAVDLGPRGQVLHGDRLVVALGQ
ncbi:hypothetical protein D3C78_1792050 [compost metagenome]